MPGYIGINCTTVCPYPTYGHRCQGLCDCNEEMCDVSNGCEPITTGIFTCSRYIKVSCGSLKIYLVMFVYG